MCPAASGSTYDAERALFDLRRGLPLYVTATDSQAPGDGVLLAAVESLTARTLEQLRRLAGSTVRLSVTYNRARAMGLTPRGTATSRFPRGLSLCLNGEGAEQILRLSTAADKCAIDGIGLREATSAEVAGLTLVRMGQLLPAIVSVPVDPVRTPELLELLESRAILAVTAAGIQAMTESSQVELIHVSDAVVPLAEAEDAHFLFFREATGVLEHVAIVIGDREHWPDPVPVRIHSACLTGDLFGSLRCDCGEQLRGSLRVLAAGGGGVMVYLAQEGRGIGLGNKLRAYALQQQGLDTVDADCTLGFTADERRYHAAVEILRHLGIGRVRLLTNNPDKVRAVREGGIRVLDRQPLYGRLTRHNLRYVRAKVHREGHWLQDMLSGTIGE